MSRVAVVLVLVLGASRAHAVPVVDYLWVEANEGGASGGHAAIRLGDDVYHFQHERGGVLRLRRDGWEQFRYAYGGLENRTMHASRVPVTAETYERLRRTFSERYLVERKLFDHAEALRDDGALLALLIARRSGAVAAPLQLRGAGFFFPEIPGVPASPAMVALRDRALATFGADFFRRRADTLRSELAQVALPPPSGDVPVAGYPHLGYPFSRRYRDLVTGLAALRAVERALPLRADAVWASATSALDLDPGERSALLDFAARQLAALMRLLVSDRPGWGFALLVGAARLQAIAESVRTGRLVVLDAFPADADVIPAAAVRRHGDAVVHLRDDARDDFGRARRRLRAEQPIGEAELATVEATANRMLELDDVVARGRALRVVAGDPPPSRDGPWPDVGVPDVRDERLVRALRQATTAADEFGAALQRRYGYDLVRRNCVSEIFTTAAAAGVALGARIETPWSLDFIPFVSARAVRQAWGGRGDDARLPSYRQTRLAEMYAREPALRVWLRESNVLTSTIYRRNPDDSFFVLFTDDVPPVRPLFGAVNLAAGLAAAGVGVPLLPFDGGHTLLAGIRGALFSVPELAFVDLRKGSFDWVPRRDD